jgi:hypothetical protein
MKTACLVMTVVMLLFGCVTASGQTCYETKLVRSWAELPAGAPEGLSFTGKRIQWMGDRLAVALGHGFTDAELLDHDRLGRVLQMIKFSFSAPEVISDEDDRQPRVTLLLLRSLREQSGDEAAKKQISDAEAYIIFHSSPNLSNAK